MGLEVHPDYVQMLRHWAFEQITDGHPCNTITFAAVMESGLTHFNVCQIWNCRNPTPTPNPHWAIGLLRGIPPCNLRGRRSCVLRPESPLLCHLPGQAWLVPFHDLRGYSSPDFGRALELASCSLSKRLQCAQGISSLSKRHFGPCYRCSSSTCCCMRLSASTGTKPAQEWPSSSASYVFEGLLHRLHEEFPGVAPLYLYSFCMRSKTLTQPPGLADASLRLLCRALR